MLTPVFAGHPIESMLYNLLLLTPRRNEGHAWIQLAARGVSTLPHNITSIRRAVCLCRLEESSTSMVTEASVMKGCLGAVKYGPLTLALAPRFACP